MRNACQIVAGKPEERTTGRPRHRWEYSILKRVVKRIAGGGQN
jgi:hypothetical protein